MSTRLSSELTTDETVRQVLLLMPRLVARAKRLPVPPDLRGLELAPRHLSLLSYLLLDGPLNVSALASRLEVAPTTVSTLVAELVEKGVLVRRADPSDARRRVIEIARDRRRSIDRWLSAGARAWKQALEPLTPAERAVFVRTLRAYENAVGNVV